MTTYRVLVFGSTGTGKTSMCNTLTGQRNQANSSARGNTFETYTYDPFEYDGDLYVVTDTVGLNESEKGTVPAQEAALQLVDLLRQSEAGFNILVHVFRAPRKTKSHDDNYEFFVKRLTGGAIPTILVATGCENEDPMETWADNNAQTFRADGCDYRDVVATCFAEGGRLEATFAPLRAESRSAVLASMAYHALETPQKIYGEGAADSFEKVLARIWNYFVDWAKLPQKYRMTLNEGAYDLLLRLGVPKPIADLAVEHLPDLATFAARRYLGVPFHIANTLFRMFRK